MKRCFYIENNGIDDDNCVKAIDYAINLKKSDPDVGRIVVLVLAKDQYSLLEPLLPNDRYPKSDHINYGGSTIHIYTLRTYRPATVSLTGKDILVTLGLDPEQFAKFEDQYTIKHLIHIPWDMDISGQWIRAHKAVNITTGAASHSTIAIDTWVKGAINWLKITSSPNSGLHHPLDENRLKVAANALKTLKVKIDEEAVIEYCLSIGIEMKPASKIFEYFHKAQTRKYTLLDRDYTLDFLKDQWMSKED